MTREEQSNLELITQILEALYKLNAKGCYTASIDWSGHINGLYIKIIKGKWEENKKQKVIFEAQISVRYGNWRDCLNNKSFDISAFSSTLGMLSNYKS